MLPWSLCMYFQQYLTILITVALYLVFKSVSVNPPIFFFLFLKNCFGYSTSFAFPYKLYNQLYQFVSPQNPARILNIITLNLYVNLGRSNLMQNHSVHEHRVYLHLLRSSHHCYFVVFNIQTLYICLSKYLLLFGTTAFFICFFF